MALTQRQWDQLLRAVSRGECTPVIGAGASRTAFPVAPDGTDWSGSGLARRWATDCGYPLADKGNLARVAQYLAIMDGALSPKRALRDAFDNVEADLSQTPYPVLASLPLPIYITTNYDDLIEKALDTDPSGKQWKADHCRWNDFERAVARTSGPPSTYQPTPSLPFVYHLHGRLSVLQSLVLTEEDYLDFLITLAEKSGRRANVLHPSVLTALASNTLMFIGYSLADPTFRVLFRGLMRSVKASVGALSVSIQVDPEEVDDGRLEDAKTYLEKYFGRLHKVEIGMYWGEANAFAAELADRWAHFSTNRALGA